jgi:hypothetical protein
MRIGKYVFDGNREGAGDSIGEVERRVVPLGFESVDRLSRHAGRGGKLLLSPAALGAKHAHAALHGREERTKGVTIPKAPQKKG